MTIETVTTNGRPCKLTAHVQDTICTGIAAGNYYITACRAAGISDSTLNTWINQGKAEQDAGNLSGKFSAFLDAIKRAEAQREAQIVSRLVDASQPGLRKTVTRPMLVNGLPLFDKDGNIRMSVEQTTTGGEWLAAATFLERRHPERWARPDRGSQGSTGNTYNINVEKAIIDAAGKFDAIVSRLAERAAAPMAIPAGDAAPDAGTETAP